MATNKPNSRFPYIEILELKPDRMVFVLSKTDTSVANALRRAMIAIDSGSDVIDYYKLIDQ